MNMSKCQEPVTLSRISLNGLEEFEEVYFSVLNDSDSCWKIKTNKLLSTTAVSHVFDQYKRPKDVYNCFAQNCNNTGTLILSQKKGVTTEVAFSLLAESQEFYAGVSTYYLDLSKGTWEVAYTISSIDDEKQTNADRYKQTVVSEGTDFSTLIVDFSKFPDEVKGKGWQADEHGIIITVKVTPSEEMGDYSFGISSMWFFRSFEELQNNELVAVGCLSELGGDFDMDVRDSTCLGTGYDKKSVKIEKELTGKKVSSNYWLLNPLLRKGEQTEGFSIFTTVQTIKEIVVNNVKYGYLLAPDLYLKECGFSKVLINEKCETDDSELLRVNVGQPINLDPSQFQVITEGSNQHKILVNQALIGKKATLAYPKIEEVEEYIGDTSSFEERHVRMYYTEKRTNGKKITYVFNNVFITSFPGSLKEGDETEFKFKISVQRDANGAFFKEQRIIS